MRRRGHMLYGRKQFVSTIRQVYVEPTYILIIVPSLVRARTEYFPTQGFVSVSCLSHTRKRNETENSVGTQELANKEERTKDTPH